MTMFAEVLVSLASIAASLAAMLCALGELRCRNDLATPLLLSGLGMALAVGAVYTPAEVGGRVVLDASPLPWVALGVAAFALVVSAMLVTTRRAAAVVLP